jgi:hypothetical protein
MAYGQLGVGSSNDMWIESLDSSRTQRSRRMVVDLKGRASTSIVEIDVFGCRFCRLGEM